MNETNFIGKNFAAFMGVIEDRNDPLKLNRFRVRCFGFHSHLRDEVPIDNLPWASVLTHIADVSTLTEGTWVFGFFIDGYESQRPIILGAFPGIPVEVNNNQIGFTDPRTIEQTGNAPAIPSVTYYTNGTAALIQNTSAGRFPRRINEPETSRLMRNDAGLTPTQNTQKQASRNAGQTDITTATGGTFSMPTISYATAYPYNKVIETESGHAIELDDTLNAERVSLFHRSGTYTEMLANGDRVDMTVSAKYNHVLADSFSHTNGQCVVTIDKDLQLLVNRNAAGHNLTVRVGAGGNLNITVAGGNVSLNVTGNVTQTISGNVTQTVGGTINQTVTGNVTSSSPTYNITGNINVTGTMSVSGDISTPSDVTAGSISLKNHVHDGVQSGGALTGEPV